MKWRYTYFSLVVILAWALLKSDSTGRVTTGTPMQSCAGGGCHTTAAPFANVAIDSFFIIDKATNLPVTQYTPGQTYRIAFFGRSTGFTGLPNLFKFGFAVDNGGKGSFGGTSSGSTTATAGRYWGHNAKKDTFRTIPIVNTIIYYDTCSWTAPNAGSGTVTFQAWLNAVNNNSASSGDFSNGTIYAKSIIEFNNTASVSVAAVGSTTFCTGTSKTFIATPTNPGTTPTYQWYLNGTPVGTGGVSYTNASLANNDSIWVVMTSSIAGITNNPATSNKVKVTVNPTYNNIVTITANKASGCAGDTVIFTATPPAGATGAQYRWYRNMTQIQGPGSPTPMSSATCQVIGLTAGDSFSCRLQVSNACANPSNDTSNYIKILVNASPIITGNINDTICAGDSSKATNWQSTIGGTTYTWTNSNPAIGLPASGTGQIPKFKTPSFIATPQINATITIRSFGGGCSGAPVTYNILVRRKPTIGLTGHQRFYCEGASGNITVTTPNPGTISWTNDNIATGIPASGNNGFINFTATNTTTDSIISNIKATAYNAATGCSIDTTFKIIIYPKPVANPIANKAPCEGANVPITTISSPIIGTTFSWINSNTAIGLAASGSGDIPSFTATNSSSGSITGTITISPKYKTCIGPNKTFNITVEKNANPSISIATSASNLCDGGSAFFTASTTNGGLAPTFEWKKNGVTIPGATKDTVTVNNILNGDNIICILTSNSPCVTVPTATSNQYTITTTKNLVPTITLSTVSDTTCVGSVLVINTTITNGGGAPTYKWFLNGNPIFGATSDVFFSNTFAMNDEITCEMTSSSGCANPKTVLSNVKKIKVFNPTPTTISISKSKNKVCADEYVTFTTSFTGGGLNPQVNWKLGGQQMNTNKKFITIPISSNTDIVELTVKSSEPCPSPPFPKLYSSVDTVLYGPIVTVSPNPYISFCEGDSAEIKILNGQPNYAYKWSNGLTTTSFYSKVSNSYTLTVTEPGNICPRYYGPITTMADPLPFKPTVRKEGDYIISSIADRYQWQLNKQDIVAADSMKYKPIVLDGWYRVQVKNNSGCIAYSDEINPSKSGISQLADKGQFIVYPNPTNGAFSIKSGNKMISEIRLFDLVGKLVYQLEINDVEKEVKLRDLPKGLYHLNIYSDHQVAIHKLEIK